MAILTFETSLGSIDDLLPVQSHTEDLNTRHPAAEVASIANLRADSHGTIRR